VDAVRTGLCCIYNTAKEDRNCGRRRVPRVLAKMAALPAACKCGACMRLL
jgi:hypothetical protein